MKESKIFMIPGFPDIETEEQGKAIKEALNTVATGCMHLLEAESVEIVGDIRKIVFMKFTNAKDPDFLSNEEVAKIAMITSIGAHSMASGNCSEKIDLRKLADTPIDQIFPEITDLLKPKKP